MVVNLRRMFRGALRRCDDFLAWLILGPVALYEVEGIEAAEAAKATRGKAGAMACPGAMRGPRAVVEAAEQINQANVDAGGGTRIISYWAESGEFFRFSYCRQQLPMLRRHIGAIAADPLINFSWRDAVSVHEAIRFMEATQDCRDVVG